MGTVRVFVVCRVVLLTKSVGGKSVLLGWVKVRRYHC